MFMIDMHLDAAKLMRFAQMQGHPLSSDEDFGYMSHAWMLAAFGSLAPKPFRILERRDGLHLLGYAEYSASALCEHARHFAEPAASEVCQWDAIASKSMPETWEKGRRLGFEVRACPVSRKGKERDVFLSALEHAKALGERVPQREKVYADWLVQRMKGATKPGGDFIDPTGNSEEPVVELLPAGISIVGLRRIKLLRSTKGASPNRRKSIERPDVLFSGEFRIRRTEAFVNLLRRGIGRHRAFGFGMLLLRPPAEHLS
ncbi:conserved hypothetical protein [uncultured Desulfatiglans sp.]|uniref:CRISPR-associated protein, Cse3 family n=1 Tax=Uncultured Desulfatiglans sp. TaxID=1748965 RepID=A0A653A9Z5_UNCDX|nr:conserved hypothetical protein [uncultured Desulfatiglans sp.]